MKKLNLDFVKLAGITLVVTLAISLGVGKKAAQAQTLFGLAHQGNAGGSTLYTIDTSNGTAAEVGPTGFNRCSGMDFDASGTLYATCTIERPVGSGTHVHVLVTIDPGTGVGEEVDATGIEPEYSTATDISFRNSNGVLFGYFRDNINFDPDALGTIDLDGSAAFFEGLGIAASGNGLAFGPNDILFHASTVSGALAGDLRTFDPETGKEIEDSMIKLFVSLPEGSRPRINAMDFDPGTRLLFASLNNKLSQGGDPENFLAIVNTTSGDVHIVGPTVAGLDAIAFGPEAAAPQAELSNFKCYDVKGPKGTPVRGPKGTPGFGEYEVTLADEFAPESITRVRDPEVFCTPVSKDGAEITATTDTTDSFTCYNIKDVEGKPNKEQHVVVWNELGDQQALTFKNSKLLCVPSTVSE